MPTPDAHARSVGNAGTTSREQYRRRSPTSTACSTSGWVLRRFSIGWGATFLPPAVTMMSFLRSVMERKPSASISPMSPVANHPSSSMTSAVASGRL